MERKKKHTLPSYFIRWLTVTRTRHLLLGFTCKKIDIVTNGEKKEKPCICCILSNTGRRSSNGRQSREHWASSVKNNVNVMNCERKKVYILAVRSLVFWLLSWKLVLTFIFATKPCVQKMHSSKEGDELLAETIAKNIQLRELIVFEGLGELIIIEVLKGLI